MNDNRIRFAPPVAHREQITKLEGGPPPRTRTALEFMGPRSLLEYALAMSRSGLNVCPPAQDGSKRPDRSPGPNLQHRRITEAELWPSIATRPARAWACSVDRFLAGLRSSSLMISASALAAFEARIEDHGLGSLWQRTKAGYWERSSGQRTAHAHSHPRSGPLPEAGDARQAAARDARRARPLASPHRNPRLRRLCRHRSELRHGASQWPPL